MRGPYNISCDVYNGPNAVPPNAFRGVALGRLVFETRIAFQGFWPNGIEAYFTTSSPLLSAGSWTIVPPMVTLNQGLCSFLDFTSIGYTCRVYLSQRIIPYVGQPYRRYYVGQ